MKSVGEDARPQQHLHIKAELLVLALVLLDFTLEIAQRKGQGLNRIPTVIRAPADHLVKINSNKKVQ